MRVKREPQRLHDRCVVRSARRCAADLFFAPPHTRSGQARAVAQTFAHLARSLRKHYNEIVTVGGETSGTVVETSDVRAVEIDPVVPHCAVLPTAMNCVRR